MNIFCLFFLSFFSFPIFSSNQYTCVPSELRLHQAQPERIYELFSTGESPYCALFQHSNDQSQKVTSSLDEMGYVRTVPVHILLNTIKKEPSSEVTLFSRALPLLLLLFPEDDALLKQWKTHLSWISPLLAEFIITLFRLMNQQNPFEGFSTASLFSLLPSLIQLQELSQSNLAEDLQKAQEGIQKATLSTEKILKEGTKILGSLTFLVLAYIGDIQNMQKNFAQNWRQPFELRPEQMKQLVPFFLKGLLPKDIAPENFWLGSPSFPEL